MRRILVVLSLVAFTLTAGAQSPAGSDAKSNAGAKSQTAVKAAGASNGTASLSPVVKDLPVRKVVLYKNGVGYFEHAGQVNGSQRVAIDFSSSQLNDVLQTLTVLDEGGGRVAAVNYNSTTPIEQQLRTLALGLKDFPATIAIYQALRGQRAEVTGAGAAITGKLVNIEFRRETDKNGLTSDDHNYLIVETDAGALRTAELTDAVSVRMIDPALQKQFANYLDIVASAQNQQVRHLVLEDRGAGERQLRVSYISEVPVWKSTYRILFPRMANGNATMQGWAVVDNTVGADWDNVELSLVAGAPQSFIQPLSQPIYTHRPEIPIAMGQQFAPETHEAAEMKKEDRSLTTPAAPPQAFMAGRAATQTVTVNAGPMAGKNLETLETLNAGVGSGNGYGPGSGGNVGGGIVRMKGVYRASDAIGEGDVSTNAFDDFFQYSLAQPVTIHKNESAMVPILQQDLPAEHVTLWSEHSRTPLRAVWLENTSKLTLDSGSFSIFENGEFAGEGLLDPIHPGEKRLVSYAADQAVRVQVAFRENTRALQHLRILKGVVIETHTGVSSVTYSATNSGDADRVLLLEHPRQTNGWTLDDGIKAAETTPNLLAAPGCWRTFNREAGGEGTRAGKHDSDLERGK